MNGNTKRFRRHPQVRPRLEVMEDRQLLSQAALAGLNRIGWIPAPRTTVADVASGWITESLARTVQGLCSQAPHYELGSPVAVSGRSMLTDLTDVQAQLAQFPNDRVFLNSAVEPQLAVNPRNPSHLVAVWQQDRWLNAGARGIGVGVSFNGGRTWSVSSIPGVSQATGGPYDRVSDPWVTFSSDGRIVYVSSLPFNNTDASNRTDPGGQSAVAVSRSFNGGRRWSDPVFLGQLNSPLVQTDKEMIVADPVRSNTAYIVWTALAIPPTQVPFNGPTYFSRTTDGGRTWEPARVIYDPQGGNIPNDFGKVASNHQLFVRPNGTLIDTFTEFTLLKPPTLPDGSDAEYTSVLTVLRSTDRGVTWSSPTPAVMLFGTPVFNPDLAYNPAIDPALRQFRTPSTPSGLPVNWADVTMDPHNGRLYAVWQDARFNAPTPPGLPFPPDAIAFAMSSDGGTTWSTPIRVNQTPSNLNPLNNQAFLPAVQIGKDGTLAVTYYDFRNNGQEPGALSDGFIVFCRPGEDPTQPTSWRTEIRLTSASFNIEKAPLTTGGAFLGDYIGLQRASHDLLLLYPVTTSTLPSQILFRQARTGERYHAAICKSSLRCSTKIGTTRFASGIRTSGP